MSTEIESAQPPDPRRRSPAGSRLGAGCAGLRTECSVVDRQVERFETKTRQLWWLEQGITRFVAGVFEGGGAKGLLYKDALEAMVEDRDRPCWFSAVAGARYSRLRRRIEDCLAFPPEGLVARLAEIQKMEDDAAEQSPPLGERRWLRWQAFAELPTPPTRGERWKMTLTPSRTKQVSGKHEA